MFVGNINRLDLASFLHPKAMQVLEKIARMVESGQFPENRQYLNDRIFLFISETQTRPLEESLSEFHQEYMDIQIVLEGKERFGYSYRGFSRITDNQLETNDIAFIEDVVDEKFVELYPGDFIVFYPGQPHRPQIKVGNPVQLKKLIAKVHKSVFLPD